MKRGLGGKRLLIERDFPYNCANPAAERVAGLAKPCRYLRASPGQLFLSQQPTNTDVHPSEVLGSCLCLTHSFSAPVPWQGPLPQAFPVGRLCRCGLVRHGGSAMSLLPLCQPPPAHIRVPPVGVLLLLCDTEQQLDMMKAPVPFLTVFWYFVPASSPSKNAQRSLT